MSCASLFSIYTEQAFVAGISLLVKCPWNQVFYISIKVLSLCSLALSTTIITMAPSRLIMPTPSITPLLLQTPYHAYAALSWTLAGSPRPHCNQSETVSVPSLEYRIGYVALGVSVGGIDEIPQGRPGTARLLLPWTACQLHFVWTW